MERGDRHSNAMRDALDALTTRAIYELASPPANPRERVGGAAQVRIALESYLQSVFEWLDARAPLDARAKKKLLGSKASVRELGPGRIGGEIYKHYAAAPIAKQPEVSALFPALALHAQLHVVNDALNEVLHGRTTKPLSSSLLNDLAKLCAALSAAFPRRPWAFAPNERVGAYRIVAAVSRDTRVERYRALRSDGTAATVLVEDSVSVGLAKTMLADGRARAVAAMADSGLEKGHVWYATKQELQCSFADIVADAGSGRNTALWALSVCETLLAVPAPGIAIDAHSVFFARDDEALSHPILLPLPNTAATLPGRAAAALVTLAATGSANATMDASVDPTIAAWVRRASEQGGERTARMALHDTIVALPRAHVATALFGAIKPTATVRFTPRAWMLAPLALVLVGLMGFTAFHFASGDDDERTVDPAQPRRTDESPAEVIARWDRAVQSPSSVPFDTLYTSNAVVHGSARERDVPGGVRDAWIQRLSHGGWFRSGERSLREQQASELTGDARRCLDSGNAPSRVLHFRAMASWHNPLINASVPCADLQGPYFWRMRVTPDGWRICHEGWEFCDAICASCPASPDCRARCRSPRK